MSPEHGPSMIHAANPELDSGLIDAIQGPLTDLITSYQALPTKESIAVTPDSSSGLPWIERIKVSASPAYEYDETDTPHRIDGASNYQFAINTKTYSDATNRRMHYLAALGISHEQIQNEVRHETLWLTVGHAQELTLEPPDDVEEGETWEFLAEELPIIIAAAHQEIQATADRHAAARHIAETQSDRITFGPLQENDGMTIESLLNNSAHQKATETLQAFGATPLFKQAIGNQSEAYYSEAFQADNNRAYIVAYVKIADTYVPQVFYTSLSQGCWRWLPGRSRDGWHSKGDDEDSLTVPPELQSTFYTIAEQANRSVPQTTLDNLLLDTNLLPDVTDGDHKTTPLTARYFDIAEYEDTSLMEPAFSKPVSSTHRKDDELYGELFTTTFASRDGTWAYTFAHNTEGLAWLTSVTSTTGKLRLNGLVPDRQPAPQQVYSHPAYEYKDRVAGSYRSSGEHTKHQQYASNFEVLAQDPAIQAYYATIPREQLSFMRYMPADAKPSPELYLYHREIANMQSYQGFNEQVRQAYCAIAAQLASPALRDSMSSSNRAGALEEAQRIYNRIQDATPDAPSAVETTAEIPFEALELGSDSHRCLQIILDGLRFNKVAEKPEKYDGSVHYEYWQSELFPGKQYVVAATETAIINMSPLVVA